LDAIPVGVVETAKELQRGQQFTPADGSTLEVRLRQTLFALDGVLSVVFATQQGY